MYLCVCVSPSYLYVCSRALLRHTRVKGDIKETYKRDLQTSYRHQKRPIDIKRGRVSVRVYVCMCASLLFARLLARAPAPQKRPIKQANTHQKRPTKETYIHQKRQYTLFARAAPCTSKENHKKELPNRPIHIKRDLQKRPIYFKRDLYGPREQTRE